MARRISFLMGLLCLVGILWAPGDAEAVKLRRPYDQNIPFNYGFDNNRGAAGCTDFACGGLCYDGHTGTDHPIALGSVVRAGEEGTVVETYNGCADYGYYDNPCGGYCGNHVRIRHDDGQDTLYCHMKLGSLAVSNGQRVSCGQQIGLSASSGSSTGPHLHVSWYHSGGVYDLFQGSCGSSVSAWTEQRGYREAVGTACGCVPSPEVCDGKDNNCDGQIDEGDVCEIDYLDLSPHSYAPSKTTDINGDGLQDVCGRFGNGWGCYLSTGTGWGEFIETDLFSDDGGWAHPFHYATIRTGDLDGDGLADVCARHSTQGYMCWRSTGSGFEPYANAPGYTNDEGWKKPEYYTTFRLADINGDGMDDVCARGPDGWFCQLSTGTGFGDTVEGPPWSDASGFARAQYYGTIQTGDINGDGMEDVCIRHSAGYECFLSTGSGFESFALLDDFSNDGGWHQMMYWSSLRLVDFNGDGKADVCGRFYGGIKCLPATDTGFGEKVDIAPLATTSGWDDPTNYQTLRTGDVDGDGAQDFCVRANAGMRCYGFDGSDTFSLVGPELSDEKGWSKPEHFHTIMVTDINADRRRDICARGGAGLYCYTRTDDGFEPYPLLEEFTNEGHWNKPQYYSTLRMGTGVCRPELCNGFDDNCNGKIDDGQPTEMGHVPPGLAARFKDADLPEQAQSGQTIQAIMRFENVGRDAWQPDELSLKAVADDPALLDQIRPDSGWQPDDTVATTNATVGPGDLASFEFSLKMPANADILDDILFVLTSDDEPLACPSPSASLSAGAINQPDQNNDPNDPNNPNDPTHPDAGSNPSDAGSADGNTHDNSDNRDKNMQSAGTSSCASTGPTNPITPIWYAFLGLLVLGGSRRKARFLIPTLLALLFTFAFTFAFTGCNSPGELDIEAHSTAPDDISASRAAPTAEPARTVEQQNGANSQKGTSEPAKNAFDPTKPEGDPRLLAIFGDWTLRGQPLMLPPNSDAAGQLVSTLSHRDEPVRWPLKDQPITNATFIPPQNAEDAPSLIVFTPKGNVLLVDLDTQTSTEIDQGAGRMASVSANGCCAAYMKGGIGLQFTLQVLDIAQKSIRSIELKHNAWSPAISPDGDQIIYIAPTDTAQTGVWQLDLTETDPEPRLLNVDPIRFPSGRQPPTWTKQGIAFSSERGAALMSPHNGQILQIADQKTRTLLTDLATGRLLSADGQPVEMQQPQ